MEKYKYDESNGLWYELKGDYYLPCLQLPEEEQVHIGIWGQRYLNYLRENRRALLSDLQLSGKLNSYLADIDQQAEEMFEHFIKQMAEREGVCYLICSTPITTILLSLLSPKQVERVSNCSLYCGSISVS